jgi:hypothetical protein
MNSGQVQNSEMIFAPAERLAVREKMTFSPIGDADTITSSYARRSRVWRGHPKNWVRNYRNLNYNHGTAITPNLEGWYSEDAASKGRLGEICSRYSFYRI